jgi:hypothetical protein
MASSDWYDKAKKELLETLSGIVSANDTPEESARAVYSYLSEIDMIDYDIEKEVLWDQFCDEEGEYFERGEFED